MKVPWFWTQDGEKLWRLRTYQGQLLEDKVVEFKAIAKIKADAPLSSFCYYEFERWLL